MSHGEIELVADAHCELGEHPTWDPERGRLLWTDIARGRLYRLDVHTGRWEGFYEGAPVGGFTRQADGTLLLFRVNEVCRLHDDGRSDTLAQNIDPDMERFNDVIADPEGRVFAGTKGKGGRRTGGLLRMGTKGCIQKLFSDTAISNGTAFSPDLRQFYWTDSSAGVIFAFEYERTTGAIRNRRALVAVAEREGTLDGLAVDAEGSLWSARYNGGAVHRYSPAGEPLETIVLPVPKVTSVAFGDADLRTLYITTAGGREEAVTEDGALYRVRVEVQGQPEFPSRVLLV